MAIMDYRAQLCDATAFSGAKSATIISTYIVDVGHAKAYPGRGEPIYLYVKTGNAFTSTSAAAGTLALWLQDSTSTTAASFTNKLNINLNGAASMTHNLLTADKLLFAGVIPPTCKRYLRIKGTIGVTPITSGTIEAWLDIAPLPITME